MALTPRSGPLDPIAVADSVYADRETGSPPRFQPWVVVSNTARIAAASFGYRRAVPADCVCPAQPAIAAIRRIIQPRNGFMRSPLVCGASTGTGYRVPRFQFIAR